MQFFNNSSPGCSDKYWGGWPSSGRQTTSVFHQVTQANSTYYPQWDGKWITKWTDFNLKFLFWKWLSMVLIYYQLHLHCIAAESHHHNRFTALFPGPAGWASASWKLLLDFVVLGRITRGRHTDASGLISNPPPSICLFLHWMPFLLQSCHFILTWDRHWNMLDCILPWLGLHPSQSSAKIQMHLKTRYVTQQKHISLQPHCLFNVNYRLYILLKLS